MYIPVAAVTIIFSSILSVQGRSLLVNERALEVRDATEGDLLDHVGTRKAKHERRKASRDQLEFLSNRGSPILERGQSETTLNANALQTGSAQTGLSGTVEAGQSASATDGSNFINFCAGQTLTNGLQTKTGSCNGIVMGKIPATTNMISAVIQFPKVGQKVTAGQTFTISVLTQGLAAGTFTNPLTTYYSAPQDLDQSGKIIGHIHVTIQDLGGSFNPTTLPDPTKFAFFKGINDAGNGDGLLSATVPDGLPAGKYRVCTMTSAANHQPVLMPVAQRGAQDDCTKFEVVGSGGTDTCNGNTNTAASCTTTTTASAAAVSASADCTTTDSAVADSTTTDCAATASATSAKAGSLTNTETNNFHNNSTTTTAGSASNFKDEGSPHGQRIRTRRELAVQK